MASPYPRRRRTEGLLAALRASGGLRPLARSLDLTPQAISMWHDIPLKYLLAVEQATGVPRETLRPDIYRKEEVQ